MNLHRRDRTNEEWLEELLGNHGKQSQSDAFEDLGKILIPYANTFLFNQRAKKHPGLVNYSSPALNELAQDFTQDTLVKLYRHDCKKLKTFNLRHEHANFVMWTRKVLINGIRDEIKRSYWQNPGYTIDEEDNGDSDSTIKKVPDGSPGPEEQIILKSAMDVLQKCLQSLSENNRIAFQKCVMEGMTAPELTGILGETNENTIYSRIHRAKAQLRKCLEDNGWTGDILFQ
jgi:RNA polymerase sigma factor (sigma-70 family)